MCPHLRSGSRSSYYLTLRKKRKSSYSCQLPVIRIRWVAKNDFGLLYLTLYLSYALLKYLKLSPKASPKVVALPFSGIQWATLGRICSRVGSSSYMNPS